jgi:hypothetical protein
MPRVLAVVGAALALASCGGETAADVEADVCGVVITWHGEAYDGIDVQDPPALGEPLADGGQLRCEGGRAIESVRVAEIRGVDPAIAFAVLPPNAYAESVSLWVLRGSPEARAAGVAFCLVEDAPDVQFAVGDVRGTAYFTRDRSRDRGRWAEWSAAADESGAEVEFESHNLSPSESDLMERCTH